MRATPTRCVCARHANTLCDCRHAPAPGCCCAAALLRGEARPSASTQQRERACAAGRGGGSFANDCHDRLGDPLPDGAGVFQYNVEYVTLAGDLYLNRIFLKATRSYAAGERREYFADYKSGRPIAMGWQRLELQRLSSGEDVVRTVGDIPGLDEEEEAGTQEVGESEEAEVEGEAEARRA